MKRLILILAALFSPILAHPDIAFAQSAPICNSATVPVCTTPAGAGEVQVKPQAVPTSTTVVAGSDAHLVQVTISATSAVTITIADRQASPIQVFPVVSIAANSTYVINFPAGYWCPGGFTIVASGTGATYHARWRQ